MPKNYYSPLSKALLSVLLFSTACVDPYIEKFTGTETIFIVEGRLTNDPSVNFVKLTQSEPHEGSSHYNPAQNAEVEVMVNGNKTIKLSESAPGYYVFPDDFSGQIGASYQLLFSTASGQRFESRVEEMIGNQGIKKVYSDYAPDVISSSNGISSGQRIYIDTDDDAATKDFYMWDWKLYEKIDYCKTCDNGFFYRDGSTDSNGECRYISFKRGYFDYQCDSQCWDIIHSSKVNIMNDDFSNGKEIQARLIAEIPIYQHKGALIEINQYKITEAAYDYLRLVISQGQETGGLADTPPATLSGNISNEHNPDQPVAGFFVVSSVSKVKHWLDKSEVPFDAEVYGLLNGRTPRPEPDSDDPTRPPFAPCIESNFRTSFLPEGWIQNI